MSSAGTVVSFLVNHDYDAREVSSALLISLESRGEFIKSLVLKGGVTADVYRVAYDADDTQWYVKFYVDDGQLVVLLSCWWDGCVH